MPKEAWALLPTLRGYNRCRLCVMPSDFQEQFWSWMREGKTIAQLAELSGVSEAVAFRHRRHLIRCYERFITLSASHVDDLKRLDLQVKLEREKRRQLELAREREERAKTALDALRDLVSADKFQRILSILQEGDENATE